MKYLDDHGLDDLLADLLLEDKPPKMKPWATLEMMAYEIRTFGFLFVPLRQIKSVLGYKPRPESVRRLEELAKYRKDHQSDEKDKLLQESAEDAQMAAAGEKPGGILDDIKKQLDPRTWYEAARDQEYPIPIQNVAETIRYHFQTKQNTTLSTHLWSLKLELVQHTRRIGRSYNTALPSQARGPQENHQGEGRRRPGQAG